MAKVITLFSGSSGNCHYISSGNTEILIDAGVCARSVERALNGIGTSLSNISAIFVTHEHIDHTRGLEVIASRYKTPIYMTELSARALIKDEKSAMLPVLRLFPPSFSADVKDIHISSFISPHDSACCVGYTALIEIGRDAVKIGIATDMGHVNENAEEALKGSVGCIIESNHDVSMLMAGPYPYNLKRRILSENGHLSNDDCARLLKHLAENGTRSFILAHLSRENNYPPTALLSAKTALAEFDNIHIDVASPDTPTELFIA